MPGARELFRDRTRQLQSLKGRPVMCILPWSRARHMNRVLQGDVSLTGKVIGDTPKDVGALIAVLLRGLPPADRRDALRWAQAGSRMSEPQMDIVPLAALMPQDASIEQLARLWNGLALMLLSLGTASADTSVGSVVANATAMASGSPFASDPMVAERQNEVLLAKSILEAALLDDEAAKKWFEDNNLAQALQHLAEVAQSGRTDIDPIAEDAFTRLAKIYDCYIHNEPLGGDALEGGALADFFRDAWSGLKEGLGKAIVGASTKVSQNLGYDPSKSSGDDSTDSSNSGTALGTADDDNSNLSETVAEELSQAKKAVAQAKAALDGGQTNIADYRAKLQDAALQQAKLQWADAILNAPTDVATILSAASPNMADPAAFLQSMLSTLSAAKTTGNLGTIKALLYALKAAAGKGDGAADSLYSMITGDPSNIADIDAADGDYSALHQKLIAQKEELIIARDVAGQQFVDESQHGATADSAILPTADPTPDATSPSGKEGGA